MQFSLNLMKIPDVVRIYNLLRIVEFSEIVNIKNLKSQNTSLAVKGALAHRLKRRTAFKFQIGRRGLERCLPLGFWVF